VFSEDLHEASLSFCSNMIRVAGSTCRRSSRRGDVLRETGRLVRRKHGASEYRVLKTRLPVVCHSKDAGDKCDDSGGSDGDALDRRIWPIAASTLLTGTGIGVILPVMPLFAADLGITQVRNAGYGMPLPPMTTASNACAYALPLVDLAVRPSLAS